MRLAVPGLFSALEKQAVIVTPSPLLATILEQQAASHRLKDGAPSWQRSPIYSLDAWLSACWHEVRYATSVPSLLSPSQERFLWQTIIEQEHPHLFDPSSAARLASRAARLLAEYRIPSEGDLWNDHDDGQQFLRWLKTFRRKCRAEDWITRADLWRLMPKWIEDGLCGDGPIIFAAFERITPALKSILEALPDAAFLNCSAPTESLARHPAKGFNDFAQELEYAARCARAAFEHNPAQTIAVLVPDLHSHRSVVERSFKAVFYPSRALQFASRPDRAFHVHPVRPLIEHPIVVNALLLLELAQSRIDYADAGAILRSPFLTGAAAERVQRARADLDLRKRRELDVSLRDLESVSRASPLLNGVWAAVHRVLRAKPNSAEFAAWSEFIGDLLKAAGWPGDTDLTQEEQEAVEQWNRVLSSLAALSLVSGPVTYDLALGPLRRLLSRPGLEDGDWFSPVQILDSAEAPALEFDFTIVAGLSDESWPPPLEVTPLIPLRLQRAHGVPGTSPESLRSQRDRLTEALFRAAPKVLATYSGRLSPAAARWVEHTGQSLPHWNGKLPRQSYAPASLDEREDILAPPYASMQPARGGTALIKAQSLCPFRAFAEFRLNARAPEDACFGFDARDRGGFVHKALQLVWNRLQTQDALRSASDHTLRPVIQEALVEAVRDAQSSPLHQLTTSAERERLESLILAWLNIERARKQSFVVETVEEECLYEVPGLRLRLRVDRIDRLKNGKVLLIDYKSGKQSREKLKCPRPAEPQLLVYAAATGHDVDGVFFGELKPREPRAVGFSREKHFDGLSATVLKGGWDSFLRQADEEVGRIANEFVQGYAAVHPVHNACEYCQIKPLCRVNECRQDEQEAE